MTAMPAQDKEVLRQLVAQKAEIAARPVHQQRHADWTRINRL